MKKMKKINGFLTGMFLLVLLFSISSCLKNGAYNTPFASAGASVDLPLAAANSNSLVTFSYPGTVTSASIPFYIDLASPKPLSTAVTAVFALDTAFLDSYNTANGTSFALMPDSVYTVVNGFNRTIPAGQRLDSMYVTFNFTKMDLTQSYILPITIQSASVPIEQWNHLLINPTVKNQFDGDYTVTGSFVDLVNATITDQGVYPVSGQLITSGPYSDEFYDAGDFIYGKLINSNGTFSYYGGFDPVFTIDPTTGKVTSVTNALQNSASNVHGRYAQLDPSGVNTYDLTNQIMTVTYDMYQGDLGNIIRAKFTETYTYTGPR